MRENKSARNYIELERMYPFRRRMRTRVRDTAIFLFSHFSEIDLSGDWIRVICYHHVFDDEITGFRRQLRFLKNYGDFISADETVNIFSERRKIDGRYFCVTFDDGFRNGVTNALPVLVENKCPAIFFIPTDYIGKVAPADAEIIREFFRASADTFPVPIEFLSWDDCRKLVGAGMGIGSHTASHVPLKGLSEERLKSELRGSMQRIEKELGIPCRHFCCPWGNPGKHFSAGVEPVEVKKMGYRSFFTVRRGSNFEGTDPLCIKRDHLIANWGDYQLHYFLSR